MSIKTSLIVVLLLVASVVAWSQPATKSQPDSKLKKYRERKAASSGATLDDARKEAESNPAGALDKVEDALAESIAKDNPFDEARSYLLLGDINARIPEWKLAAQNYEKAYNILKTSNKTSAEFKNALTGLAKSNMESGNHQTSIDNYNELLTLPLSVAEKTNAQLALSELRYRMGDYDESLKIAQTVTSNSQQQNMLAKNFAKKNDFEKTNKYFDSSLNQLRAAPKPGVADYNSLQSTKEEVANSFRDQKRYDDEIAIRNQAIEYNLETKNLGAVSKDKVEISKSLELKGSRSEALKELIEAVAIADSIDNPQEQANAYLSLADLYEKNGQTNNALGAYRRYSEAVNEINERTAFDMQQRALLITKQSDIEELSKSLYIDRSEDNAQKAVISKQQFVIYGLIAVVLIMGVAATSIQRSAQASRKANQLLALKSLRSQMNPHFIFNALNSVNHFIAQQDERTANKFLSEFSQLMRLVLEYSQEDFITLQKEQEILSLYMKLEHYRFRDKFEYEIDIDESINAESILVPPMLIQPYLENAVWHGLRYRDSVGFLKMSMVQKNDSLIVTITDNGIGRKKSAELKTENQKKHKSTGLKNIKERLTILNNVYKKHYEVNVSDGVNGEGTKVQIKFPV
jgi:tetratricopeptide (TPR) repeat protein